MVEYKRYKRTYRKHYSYTKMNRTLQAIWAQNEQITTKLRDIEDFLYRKFANTVTRQVFEDKPES